MGPDDAPTMGDLAFSSAHQAQEENFRLRLVLIDVVRTLELNGLKLTPELQRFIDAARKKHG